MLLMEIALLERRIHDAELRRQSLPQKAENSARDAAKYETEYQKVQLCVTALILKRKEEELNINTERGNLRKWEKRANEIQGERAYSGLLSEIGAKKKFISDSEDKVLQLMQEIENAEKLLAKNGQLAKESSEEAAQEWQDVKAELAHLDAELIELKKDLDKLLVQLPPIEKIRYERIKSKRQGLGIAFLEKEVCQSCRHTLPPELFLRVLRGQVIEQCPSCQRILVVKPVEISIESQP